MKFNATVVVAGKIMAYETCGIPKILITIRHLHIILLQEHMCEVKITQTLNKAQ